MIGGLALGAPALLLSTLAAFGADLRPVRAGDTVESIAAALGDGALADEIRSRNGLAPGAQPVVGQILTLPPPASGPGIDQEAFLLSIDGAVSVRDPAGTVVPAVPFRSLPTGSTVCTGDDGHAALRIAAACDADGASADDVVLDAATCVIVESAFASSYGRSTLIRVTRGSITVADAPGAPTSGAPGHVVGEPHPGQLTVRTASGLATGGEGGFRVHVEAEAMRAEAITAPIRVLGGAVQGGAVELALAARQGSRVPTGGAPLPAVDLLVETALRTPEPRTPLGRPTFRWDPVPDAFAYRIEVSTNRAFTGLVYAETVAEPEHRPAMLLLPSTATGIAWWRVAPVDRFGFLGVPSDPWPFEIPGAIGP